MNTFEKAIKISNDVKADFEINPRKYRVLTGERPTGNLHIGHFFGSLLNRIELQKKGIEMFILIADYQVLTDHDSCDKISQNVREIVKDYIAAGIDFDDEKTCVFMHSHIPELNQLLVPFLTLVSMAELERNPTVKEEIQSAKTQSINAGMLVYPVHQAADILSVNANLVPVGKDQLPHLELSRTIARRFNSKFAPENPVFREPIALLSDTPNIIGLYGKQKMSKSRGNAIMLKSTREEIIEVVKKAVTDNNKNITFDPINRPEVANLLLLCSLMSGEKSEKIANNIGDKGAVALKDFLIETTDKFLTPIRNRRLNVSDGDIENILKRGVERTRSEASHTLANVTKSLNMKVYL
jgi:tryptophanyl-tRNA synthetase